MVHPSTPLLFLLESIKQAGFLETYFYFPHLIVAGDRTIEHVDFEYLVSEAYVTETNSDLSGKQYCLTLKAEQILSDAVCSLSKEEIVFAMN